MMAHTTHPSVPFRNWLVGHVAPPAKCASRVVHDGQICRASKASNHHNLCVDKTYGTGRGQGAQGRQG